MLEEAVILASGFGTRLRSLSDRPKFAFPLFGRPLIHYPILSLRSAGVKKFYVIVAKGYAGLAFKLLNDFNVLVLENEKPERENGYTLFYARNVLKNGPFFVSVCDHIYPTGISMRLKEAYSGEDILIAGDRSPRHVELNEATKIKVNDRVRVSKRLKKFDYVDTGLFIFSSNIFSFGYEREKRLTLNRLITLSSGKGYKVNVVDVTGIPWKDVDTPDDVNYLATERGSEVLETWRSSL